MIKFFKLSIVISLLLWCSVIFHLLALEIFGLKVGDLLVSGIISLVALVSFYVWFVWNYLRNKKTVQSLKAQYLESLKPTKPLLFCPTDDELVRRDKEINSSSVLIQTKDEDQKETQDEQEEIELI